MLCYCNQLIIKKKKIHKEECYCYFLNFNQSVINLLLFRIGTLKLTMAQAIKKMSSILDSKLLGNLLKILKILILWLTLSI